VQASIQNKAMKKYIYHILDPALDPNEVIAKNDYTPAGFAEEGFIHCSEKQQVSQTLNKWFEGNDSVHLFRIETDKVTASVIFEDLTESGVDFPHIYGALNTNAIVETTLLKRNSEGEFNFE
jgi:uncharacterized protein (DUF952 family)